jgi:hypothetical protein
MNSMATKETKSEKNKTTGAAVLVTTTHRGVFFGYLLVDESPKSVKLERVRNVVYWPTDARGFLGLAANGPPSGCRVGPAAPDGKLFDITAVITCSEEAVKRFEGEPWAK